MSLPYPYRGGSTHYKIVELSLASALSQELYLCCYQQVTRATRITNGPMMPVPVCVDLKRQVERESGPLNSE